MFPEPFKTKVLKTAAAFLRRACGASVSLFFPPSCPVCGGASGGGLCAGCGEGFVYLPGGGVCDLCGNPLVGGGAGVVCGACLSGRDFSVARSVVVFSGPAATAARRFKYAGDLSLAGLFSSLVIERFPEELRGFDLMIPVPLHPRRLREREFNQAAVVSSAVAAATGRSHAPFLMERVVDTTPQASFPGKGDRKRNVRGAFRVAVSRRSELEGRNVLVFDDIFTTGATIEECSKTLLRAGAGRVGALTVFRTPI